ncbi:MAG: hypothetical protein J5580_02735 [Clostridia bacterium]|nr:hypothetical protein [Clostridia bacterium]
MPLKGGQKKTMANYNVLITNGVGSESMEPGTYTVTATYAPGYDLTTLAPTSYTVTSDSQTGAFTLSANGTLTITFNETGATGGTPITAGTVVMTDATGETQYGPVVNIDANGVAIFDNVPYGSTQSAYTLYFKQLTSDASHNVYPNVFAVGMGGQTQSEYILNTPKMVEQNFTLTDANYTGMPIENANLNFTANA